MNTANVDLFGEKRIAIAGNKYLEAIANHVLELIDRDSTLINGKSIGEIHKQVYLAVMFDYGLGDVLRTADKEIFRKWFLTTKCPSEEEVARAVRHLSSEDIIRLPKDALITAEQHRQHIARSMR